MYSILTIKSGNLSSFNFMANSIKLIWLTSIVLEGFSTKFRKEFLSFGLSSKDQIRILYQANIA